MVFHPEAASCMSPPRPPPPLRRDQREACTPPWRRVLACPIWPSNAATEGSARIHPCPGQRCCRTTGRPQPHGLCTCRPCVNRSTASNDSGSPGGAVPVFGSSSGVAAPAGASAKRARGALAARPSRASFERLWSLTSAVTNHARFPSPWPPRRPVEVGRSAVTPSHRAPPSSARGRPSPEAPPDPPKCRRAAPVFPSGDRLSLRGLSSDPVTC